MSCSVWIPTFGSVTENNRVVPLPDPDQIWYGLLMNGLPQHGFFIWRPESQPKTTWNFIPVWSVPESNQSVFRMKSSSQVSAIQRWCLNLVQFFCGKKKKKRKTRIGCANRGQRENVANPVLKMTGSCLERSAFLLIWDGELVLEALLFIQALAPPVNRPWAWRKRLSVMWCSQSHTVPFWTTSRVS